MKTAIVTALVIIVVVIGVAAGVYYGVPFMMDKETAGLKGELTALRGRLDKTEAFISQEEEARRSSKLGTGADASKIIREVNALVARVDSLEASSEKCRTELDNRFKAQEQVSSTAMKDLQSRLQKATFQAALADTRERILKARIELLARNLGNAKTELDLLSGSLERIKKMTSEENRSSIAEIHTLLKKAQQEVTADQPGALARIDLMWHESGKLVKE
ncbi:MAG TPA: hypothetical protein DCR97_05960 [Deltaproteobacteria bacterium]|nr:hypothetical protein [Deltaproteobacteria bacterium]